MNTLKFGRKIFQRITNNNRKILSKFQYNTIRTQQHKRINYKVAFGGIGITTSCLFSLYSLNLCEVTRQVQGGTYSPYRPFMLLDALIKLAPLIDHTKLLNKFKSAINSKRKVNIDEKFVEQLFKECGINDSDVALGVFQVMDWNGNGKLDPVELASTFTLFNVGSLNERYKFLFKCIDLDDSNTIDKTEFRMFLSSLLETQYRLKGLSVRDDEKYANITPNEYRTVAKLTANEIVRDIFNYADKNRDGELSQKEFMSWCRRGGKCVDLVKDILVTIVDERKHNYGIN